MTELAKNAKITRSRLSHAVARLEKNGWVRREDCPSDKRGQNAILTDEGYESWRRPRPAMSPPYARRSSTGSAPSRSAVSARSCRSIADGLQPKDRRGPALAPLTEPGQTARASSPEVSG